MMGHSTYEGLELLTRSVSLPTYRSSLRRSSHKSFRDPNPLHEMASIYTRVTLSKGYTGKARGLAPFEILELLERL